MRLSHIAIRALIFVLAAVACTAAARTAVGIVERVSVTQVQEDLVDADLAWTSVLSDGLQVILEGQAPSEAARFRAISTASGAVDASRVIDNMTVAESDAVEAPEFALEILRSDSGISIIGLVPASSGREQLARRIGAIADDEPVADFLEAADYPAPASWEPATDYALSALRLLDRVKISVTAGRVEIAAIAESAEQKAEFEDELDRAAPDGLERLVEIMAPRPVIAPYAVRLTVEPDGPTRFDACAAPDAEAVAAITAAATAAGFDGTGDGASPCIEALGAPTDRWSEAVVAAIEALSTLDGGSVTLSNTEVLLQGLETTDADTFQRTAAALQSALPPVFDLATDLPRPPAETEDGPPSFSAVLADNGTVQLRGPIPDDLTRVTAENYAAAKFGAANVTMGTQPAEGLPGDWQVRILAGIEALAQLGSGSVTMGPDSVEVRGETGQVDAPAIITTLLIEKLGEGVEAELDIEYVEALDPSAGLPTPQECVDQIGVVTANRKILFDPGSSTLTSDSQAIMDDIAEILQRCGDLPLQIAGYTDSQGRESMNQQLSQERANAVLDALRVRRVPISSFTAEGFGEENPIADNDTADGREANRRIEFSLLQTETGEDGTAPDAGTAEAAPEADQ